MSDSADVPNVVAIVVLVGRAVGSFRCVYDERIRFSVLFATSVAAEVLVSPSA